LRRAAHLTFSLVSFALLLSIQTAGNPVPAPNLLMPKEQIDAVIYADQGRLQAIVEGVYLFSNMGHHESAWMFYPVPPDATGIEVYLDGEALPWSEVAEGDLLPTTYQTPIGDYRMIKWEVDPVPDRFTVKVRYKHEVPRLTDNGRYAFVYAVGTGRFVEFVVTKETIAYIKVRMELSSTDLEVSTDHTPVDYRLDQAAAETVISLVRQSVFQPMTEDLLIQFNRVLSVPEAIDADGDGRISDEEMLQAVRYWLNDEEVPGTGGQRINELTLRQLGQFWVIGERFVLTPYQARDRAIEHLLVTEPSIGIPQEAIWDAERVTPEGLVGHETIRYTHGNWQIDVDYPVIPYPDYEITVRDSETGFTWQGTIRATGIVEAPT
jgi:hypothetical protein